MLHFLCAIPFWQDCIIEKCMLNSVAICKAAMTKSETHLAQNLRLSAQRMSKSERLGEEGLPY